MKNLLLLSFALVISVEFSQAQITTTCAGCLKPSKEDKQKNKNHSEMTERNKIKAS